MPRHGPPTFPATPVRRAGWTVAVLSAVAILALTLVPGPEVESGGGLTCLRCAVEPGRLGADLLANLLLFIPLGIGLRLTGLRTSRVLMVSVLASLGIELMQQFVVFGRFSSPLDVAANTTGGGLGSWAVTRALKPWRWTPLRWKVLARAAGLLWAGVLGLGCALLIPRVPEGYLDLRGSPPGAAYRHDSATAPLPPPTATAALNGAAVDPRQGADLWSAMEAGGAVLTATFPPARPAARPGVLRLQDGHGRPVIVLDRHADTIRMRIATAAAALRLRAPAIEVMASGESPGAASVSAVIQRHRLALTAQTSGSTVTRAVRLGPNMAWALIIPFDPGLAAAATAAWILLWSAVVAFLAGRAGNALKRRSTGLEAVGWLVIGFAWLPPLFGAAVPLPWEWLVGIGGLATGWQLARWTTSPRRLRTRHGRGVEIPLAHPTARTTTRSGHVARVESEQAP